MRRMLYTTLAGCVLLTACGNDHDQSSNASSDAFVQQTSQVIALPEATAELVEPQAIDTIVETQPDDTEPQAVTF